MHIGLDVTHAARAARQLGYRDFTISDSQQYGGVSMPAFILDDADTCFIFEVASAENDDQPVLTMHSLSEEGSADVEIKWIGARALLAFSTHRQIVTIVDNQRNSFLADNFGSEELIDAIKDVDHTFVTPDAYITI